MTFNFSVPTAREVKPFELAPGGTIIFVGANGGGKTRLAVHVENALGLHAHRISAHRALNLNPDIAKISERQALNRLRTGNAQDGKTASYRQSHRWGGKAAVNLLSDFDYVIQALFAEQSNTSLKAYNQYKPGAGKREEPFQFTKFDRLNEIWGRLLPRRQLDISGDDILVSLSGSDRTYRASEMSDGERAIFYLIGQVLVADENTVLIVDEPELHVHRSIMSKLWDEMEALRPDCAFVFITHDLDFAAARKAQKFVIQDYDPKPHWMIVDLPESSGFDEELTTLILGSRRPVLFVEGDHTSLDTVIYRCCYPEWTVIPRGSCTEVIHSVVTMRRNADLTRITCSGIVDADDYEDDDKAYLKEHDVETLPVSEIENIILLPAVSKAIAEAEGYADEQLEQCLSRLADAVFETVNSPNKIQEFVVRYCKRRIDRMLKKVDLSSAGTVSEIKTEYLDRTRAIDIESVARHATEQIGKAIEDHDLEKLLAHYDNKGLMALAACHLKSCRLSDFENWLTRTLRNETAPSVTSAIYECLPEIAPR